MSYSERDSDLYEFCDPMQGLRGAVELADLVRQARDERDILREAIAGYAAGVGEGALVGSTNWRIAQDLLEIRDWQGSEWLSSIGGEMHDPPVP